MYRVSYIIKWLLTAMVVSFILYYYSAMFNYTTNTLAAFVQSAISKTDVKDRTRHMKTPRTVSDGNGTFVVEIAGESTEEKMPLRIENEMVIGGNLTIKRPLKVVFRSLDGCSKPDYLPGYQALCYKQGYDIKCLPNYHLIGIRKCGTTDVVKWFQYHSEQLEVNVRGDQISSRTKCPMDYFDGRTQRGLDKKTDLMNYAPGQIMFSSVKSRNDTHIEIISTMHYLAYINDPQRTKYLLTLRNPTDRLISYLFHAHNKRWIHAKISKNKFDGDFVHSIVTSLIDKLRRCIDNYGELACTYMHSSRDGNLDAVLQHGFYVVYLEEIFKVIPREMIYINQLEEYSGDQMGKATEFMKFFGKTLQVTEEELKTSKKQRNTGTKSTVLPETTKLLDKLYEPYNLRLAMLLNDDKWLYKR